MNNEVEMIAWAFFLLPLSVTVIWGLLLLIQRIPLLREFFGMQPPSRRPRLVYCRKCGTTIEKSAAYCYKCGSSQV